MSSAVAPALGFRVDTAAGIGLGRLTQATEVLSGIVLAVDVVVVFLSVVYRYFLHDPVDWAEEIARALMIVLVFFGAATVLARSQHVGVDLFRDMLPAAWRPAMIQLVHWVIAGVSATLCLSSVLLLVDTWEQTTSIGLPQWLYVFPVVFGSAFMTLFGIANACNGPQRLVLRTLVGGLLAALLVYGWNRLLPDHAIPHGLLLALGFVGGLVLGMPIGFVLAFASLLYFLSDPSLPILVSSWMIAFAQHYGSAMFLLLSVGIMIVFGAVLEGAPALIIFGPLLAPIAQQLGIDLLHFGTVMVIAMGLSLFAPPIGLGL